MDQHRSPDGRIRPSSPIQGDDMFHTHRRERHNSPFFKRGADDPDDFWGNLDERNAQHRQQLKLLLIGIALICLLGIVIHTTFFVFAIVLLMLVPVELFMIRHTRTRLKIPDYRPPERVEIDLDADP